MDRFDAVRRVKALREVTVERGATPAEALTAQRKAQQITERFGIADTEMRKPRVRDRPMRAQPSTVAYGFPMGPPPIPDWEFDPTTGKHSKNVKVHHYANPGNWRIEIT